MDPNLAFALLGLVWYATFVIHITFHEGAHALVAKWLGDETAYVGGQATLNPLPHMEREPVGTIVVPVATYIFYTLQTGYGFMLGWAHVPVDPYWTIRYPKRAATMALAGPLANLLLAIVAAIAIRIGLSMGWLEFQIDGYIFLTAAGPWKLLAQFLSILFFLGFLLFLFNLLPTPPLDGSRIVCYFMSHETAARWQHFSSQFAVQIMGLIAAFAVFRRFGGALIGWVLSTLFL